MGNVCDSSLAGRILIVGKLVVDFLSVIIEYFPLTLTAEALIRRNWPLLKKWVRHFGAKY